MGDFKNKINVEKQKIRNEKLSEEFKNNLKIIMDNKYYNNFEDSKVELLKGNNNYKNKKIKFLYSKKIAVVFFCFIIVSSLAFAGDWENFLAKIFYNMDQGISIAIEDGYLQNINMDYVESNDVKIKVDYILFDDQRLYISLNINSQNEFEDIYLNEFYIKDENNDLIFDSESGYTNILFKTERKKIDKNSIILLNKIENLNSSFNNFEKVKIQINKIEFKNNEKSNLIDGNWNFEINIKKSENNFNIEKIDGYFVNSQNLIDDSSINIKNSKLNANIKIDNIVKENIELNKNNIYLEDKNGNKYYSEDNILIKENNLIFSINFPKEMELDNSKLIIEYSKNQEEIILNLREKNG